MDLLLFTERKKKKERKRRKKISPGNGVTRRAGHEEHADGFAHPAAAEVQGRTEKWPVQAAGGRGSWPGQHCAHQRRQPARAGVARDNRNSRGANSSAASGKRAARSKSSHLGLPTKAFRPTLVFADPACRRFPSLVSTVRNLRTVFFGRKKGTVKNDIDGQSLGSNGVMGTV
jgi:hypothetical protein